MITDDESASLAEVLPPPIRIGKGWRFLIYGLIGWCIELVFTAIHELAFGSGSPRLMGHSYLWMHPIWGIGILSCELTGTWLKQRGVPWIIRGLPYIAICFAVEYVAGATIRAVTGAAPWDYSSAEWGIHGLIRLDYAPFWALCGWSGEIMGGILRRVEIKRT